MFHQMKVFKAILSPIPPSHCSKMSVGITGVGANFSSPRHSSVNSKKSSFQTSSTAHERSAHCRILTSSICGGISVITNFWARTTPRVTPLIDTAETLTQATAKAAQNAVNIRGVLKFSSLLNSTQVKLERDAFVRDYLNISNAGGIAATDQSYEFHPTNTAGYSVPPEQMNAINASIYSYLGISAKIVDGTFSEDEFQSFYESVIEPFALQMSLEFSRKCGTDVQFSSERLEFSSAKTLNQIIGEPHPQGDLWDEIGPAVRHNLECEKQHQRDEYQQ